MENFPSESSLYLKIPNITYSQNMLFITENDLNNLKNENKELKNRIIELKKI